MSTMNELDKVRVMLPHWIEHNQGHGAEFSKWADKLESSSPEIAELLRQAAASLQDAEKSLQATLKRSGGPLHSPAHQHHAEGHHHHSP